MIEKWYDVCCDICGCYLSVDYGRGMDLCRKSVIKWAKEEGWTIKGKQTLCVCCSQDEKDKY